MRSSSKRQAGRSGKSREQIQAALSGPIASIRTPFTKDGSIDYPSLQKMVEFNIQGGSRALLLTWGDSLFALLRDQEIAELTRAVVEYSADRAVVVACTGMWAPAQSLEFAAFCKDLGADILQVFLPFWYAGAYTQDDIVECHQVLATQMPLAVNSYVINRNGPVEGMRVALDLLNKVSNIYAIKLDVEGDFDRNITSLVHEKWTVFAGGFKSFHMDVLPYGCQGYLSTFISFIPNVAKAYWKAIGANDLTTAVSIIEKIDRPFFKFIFDSKGGFDAGTHGLMEICGLAQRWRRKPFYSLNDQELDGLADFMRNLPKVENLGL